MLFSITFAALTAALSLAFGNAAPASAHRVNGRNPNSYIVKLKDGVNTTNHINSLPFLFSAEDENSPIKYWWPEGFIGYSGIFEGAALDAIRASPDVEYVEKNGRVCFVTRSSTHVTHTESHAQGHIAAQQTNAPWNLQALSSRVPVGGDPLEMKYTSYS